MVPSNFKQNVKENANLAIEKKAGSMIVVSGGYIAERKLIFLNASIRRVQILFLVFDHRAI